ncbi:DEAD/DEAH box helicase [Shewanella sp. D64]|uniref:DEAD/DEAH box helicase n=1 Tax=unclassified Shewanella TaxID=196818 RepID=UPI0022BA1237|nr:MULTISPECIES: DEAD/DEAH box helicase [unclassified Shewanella]MEC4726804.1 DEAD/DEAH box helicase [Shewanella sp. D64]MEC4739084.1 DEAD/DEAH box helicase [Shewanella sp. E94]WBJ95940.1 DEAD/DEAH box helicase [Shewanella sp. MTB7]
MLKPITLVGEQRKVLTLSHEGPIQIKGAAGSGKTTVAVYRACHLMDSHSDMFEPSKVAIFTFNKSLSGYLNELTHSLNKNDYTGMKIINFHKWAYAFIKENGIDLYDKTLFDNKILSILRPIVSSIPLNSENSRILTKSTDFFCDEISWLKGRCINSLDEYINVSRVGRGKTDRVLKTDRPVIWEVFSKYKEELGRIGKCDFDDYALLCLALIEKKGDKFIPPFTHLVIDEAQDLNKAQVSVLTKVVSPNTSSITIIADAAQRIYKSGFNWKEVGLNVTGGRTVEFKKNYRNTIAIAKAALSLLEKDNDSDDFTKVELGTVPGEKPLLKKLSNSDSEQVFIATRAQELRRDYPQDSICILHRTHQGIYKIIKSLEKMGLEHEKINGNADIHYSKADIKISTMQSVKGLEFDHILICDLHDDNLPVKSGFSEPDDDLHITTERRLLYTCMTRAVKSLTLTYSGTPSRYFKEIDSNLLESH